MRYAIVDMDGASLEYSDTRTGIVEALREIATDGSVSDLFVVGYEEDGTRVGAPIGADELLASTNRAPVLTAGVMTKVTFTGVSAEVVSNGDAVVDTKHTGNLIPS